MQNNPPVMNQKCLMSQAIGIEGTAEKLKDLCIQMSQMSQFQESAVV